MKYKMVVSDLDGTLLNSNHKLSQYTIDIIKKISEKGIKFVIATGRHNKDARYFFNQIETGKYLISGNGSFVNNELGEVITRKSISKELTKKLLELKVQEGTSTSIYIGGEWFTNLMVPDYIEFHKESKFTPKVCSLENFKDKKVEKIFFIHKNREVIEKLEKQLYELGLDKELNISTSQPTCLELMDKSVNNGEALKNLLEYEKISAEEVIAFGDALNDKEMLELVGKGVIMGNGDKKLQNLLPNCEIIGTSDEESEGKFLEKIYK